MQLIIFIIDRRTITIALKREEDTCFSHLLFTLLSASSSAPKSVQRSKKKTDIQNNHEIPERVWKLPNGSTQDSTDLRIMNSLLLVFHTSMISLYFSPSLALSLFVSLSLSVCLSVSLSLSHRQLKCIDY